MNTVNKNEQSAQMSMSEDKQFTINGKPKHKNDAFYVKKRGLFRKCEQVVKQCDCDVFVVVHHHQ